MTADVRGIDGVRRLPQVPASATDTGALEVI
jgi:hypothetical protein